MTPHPFRLLLGVGLAVLCLTAPAWAHPGHDSPGAASAPTGLHTGWETLPRHAPTAAGLVVAALYLLATMPHRRRALALAVVLPLSIVSLEGVLHAALHLHHVRHADSLAIGASPAQPAAADPDTEKPSATPVILLGEVAGRYDDPIPDLVVSSGRGRAPPPSPA